MQYPFGDYVEPPGPVTEVRWAEANATSDRFQVIEHPALPGKCVSCGYAGGDDGLSAGYRRKFVDWNFSLDMYGAVVICMTCVTEMSKLVGYIPPDAYKQMQEESVATLVSNQELRRANSELRDVVHTLSSPDARPHFIVVSDERAERLNNLSFDSTESGLTETEQVPNESTNVEGSNVISSIIGDGSVDDFIAGI
jgi:hypothetical protein